MLRIHSEDIGKDFERIAEALAHALQRSIWESVDHRFCENPSHTGLLSNRLQQISMSNTGNHRSTPKPCKPTLKPVRNIKQPQAQPVNEQYCYKATCIVTLEWMWCGVKVQCSGHSIYYLYFRPTKWERKGASSREWPISVKPTQYQRDIICLPNSSQQELDGVIQIASGKTTVELAEMGLFGKSWTNISLMTKEDVKSKICQVLMTLMGLSTDNLVNKHFEFTYLQKTDLGSRSLCLPGVSYHFEWNGKHVSRVEGLFIHWLWNNGQDAMWSHHHYRCIL